MVYFVLGKPGSGKTRFCMEEILRRQKVRGAEQGGSIVFVVPEQFSLKSEREIVRLSKGAGLYRVQVSGFNRLAFSVLAEVGDGGRKTLEDTGKNMLIRRVLGQLRTELAFYRSAFDKQGFIDSVGEQISEFRRYGIKTEQLEDIAGSETIRESIRLKTADLAKILKVYEEFCAQYISGDNVLDLLSDFIVESENLRGADVFIDGFKDFTPQEYRAIAALLSRGGDVFVTLTFDKAGGALYEEQRKTRTRLQKIAEDMQLPWKNVYMEKNYRESLPPLRFLRDNFPDVLNEATQFAGDVNETLKIYSAANVTEEIDNAARLVLNLMREGLKAGEIAVVTNALGEYEKIVSAVFARYKIPVFVDGERDILSHPLTEWVRALVGVCVSNRGYEEVFHLLKTGLCGFLNREADLLENYVLAYGIKGYKWNKFLYGFREGESKGAFDRQELNDLRLRFLNIIRPFESKFDNRKKTYPIIDFCTALYSALLEAKIDRTIEKMQKDFTEKGELEQAAALVQVWGAIIDVLDKMTEIIGQERVTIREFAKILDAGLSAAKLKLAPPGIDEVAIGDLRRSRLGDIKALIILGVNDGILPSKIDEAGLFTDDEKEILEENGMEFAPTGIRRSVEERFLIFSAISKPTHFLSLSSFAADAEGKSRQMSSFIGELLDIFPKLTITDTAEEMKGLKGVTSIEPMFDRFTADLRHVVDSKEKEIPAAFAAVLSVLREDSDYSGKIEALLDAAEMHKSAEKLSESTVKAIYKDRYIRSSVSKLEQYSECPFAYYLKYNISARERKLYDLQSTDIGSIFHDALNDFALSLRGKGLKWSKLDEETLRENTEQAIEAATGASEILRSDGQYAHFGERAKEVIRKSINALNEHINRGKFGVAYTEVSFTDTKKDESLKFDAIKIPVGDNAEMILEGRIDRVDVLEDGENTFVKIIDYKSGKKTFSEADVADGVQLQLLLYLDAFIKKYVEIKQTGNVIPAAVLYFTLANPFIKEGQNLLEDYKMSGVVLGDRELVAAIDEKVSENSSKSDIIPVEIKKDGEFGRYSKTYSDIEFDSIIKKANEKAKEIAAEILNGNIAIKPLRARRTDACEFCGFRAICLKED